MSNTLISDLANLSTTQYRSAASAVNGEGSFRVKDCTIDFEISFNTGKFSFVEFINCTFNKKVQFANLIVSRSFDFKGCTFNDVVIFHDLTINGKSRFWESTFKSKTEFNNVSFKDLADFFKVTFEPIMIFYKVDFFSTTVFTETSFKKNVLFTYTKIADVIIFTRTAFSEGLDLSLAIITGQVNIHSSDLKKFADVKDISDNDEYRRAIEETGIITRSNKRETYRILKKFSKEDYNQFKYLEYSKLENEVYYKQLKANFIKRFNNFIIFLLNKYSNDHNMSWLTGVAFTTIIGFVFFYFALISTGCFQMAWYFNCDVFVHYLGVYFNFLSPLHTFDIFIHESPNTGTIALDFVGRIFVGYGIYQTVQAFRKHKG